MDGANDNLSGCFVAMSVLKEMAERGFRFAHTQVCCLITGAEESGLRGALACAKKHLAEFSRCETVFIVLDTLRRRTSCSSICAGRMACKTAGLSGAARAGRPGVRRPLPEAKPYPGATDAEAFSRYGLARGLCVSHTPPITMRARYGRQRQRRMPPACWKYACGPRRCTTARGCRASTRPPCGRMSRRRKKTAALRNKAAGVPPPLIKQKRGASLAASPSEPYLLFILSSVHRSPAASEQSQRNRHGSQRAHDRGPDAALTGHGVVRRFFLGDVDNGSCCELLLEQINLAGIFGRSRVPRCPV